jgi:hypothetical protein
MFWIWSPEWVGRQIEKADSRVIARHYFLMVPISAIVVLGEWRIFGLARMRFGQFPWPLKAA